MAALTQAGCGAEGADPGIPAGAAVITVTDDAGAQVRLAGPAVRVLSLVPAGTETVMALGASERLVGRTRYDTLSALAHLPSVGGGLDPSLEAVTALDPDLVIAFETAGGSPLRVRLERMGIPVFGIQTQDTSDIFRNIDRLGTLLGRRAAADSLRDQLRSRLAAVQASTPPGRRPRVLFVAGMDPPIVAGQGTFVTELLGVAGGEPVAALAHSAGLWPQLSFEELVRQDADLIMLPVSGDPGRAVARLRSAAGWRELRAVREGRIVTVDADVSNRPGPQIGESAERMRDALLPHLGGP